ncbi:MAG: alginate lyase family protein [Waddliaceae bacterium]
MRRSFIRKLFSMGFGEILFRSKAMMGRWREERYYALGLGRNPEAALLEKNGEEAFFDNPWIDVAEQTELVNRLLSQQPTYAQKLQQAADLICKNQFVFFGFPVNYGSKIPWCADPVSGKEWPMAFHTHVDIFGGNKGIGDVKYVWELNRHQFLPTLGKAYLLTGDEKYAEHGLELMEHWIQVNSYKLGINWTSALEVAIRCLSWCWACALFQHSKFFSQEKRQNILRSLYQHGRYLEDHLSFYFSPYNHLIGEATALYVLGTLLPQLRSANGWLEKGWKILEEEMPKQFHADGGTVEQAFGYHHFTLGFYLQALLLRRKRGLRVPPKVWSLLENVFGFSLHIIRPDGTVAMTGDGDEGRAFDLSQASLWDFRCFLSIGAVLFQRGDFKKIAGPLLPDVTWLIGKTGWNLYHSLTAETPSENSKAMSQSGYYIMRTSWDQNAHHLSFDCGEIAHGVPKNDFPSAAHGHADALSFELSSFGKTLLVDPGFYTYNGDVVWHRYFRETEAHNTVVVDGCSQAEYRGRLKWSHGPSTHLAHWVNTRITGCFEMN